MSDVMRPVPFDQLMERIFGEYRNHGSIFGIPKESFYRGSSRNVEIFGQKCSTPVGPAAGPHTQLAQNIISAYLCGGRFLELKTVQIMDWLGTRKMIAKPCIDARDEGYNVEWSTEYTLEKAYDEYLKAWFAIHFIQVAFNPKAKEPDFIFNMSVGYNLEGIKEAPMQTFIDCMIDARKSSLFDQYRTEIAMMVEDGELLAGTDLEKSQKALVGLENRIGYCISPSVTISTMHGCPPKEIEAICTYMLTEKKLNTFVKLNPTLLGYDKVSAILRKTGFEDVVLKRESFDHDLQYSDAVAMLSRLIALAKSMRLGFGVKLTNTLGNANDGAVLPGEERYMSGRALLPISTAVAAKLSEEFNGSLPISYSGGASIYTIKDIFDTGIRPITVATDMLKPGGYARLARMAELLDKESKTWNAKSIDSEKVKALAENALTRKYLAKAFRGDDKAKADDPTPMFDCFISPCMEACPVHQNIPDYISLVGEGKYAQALETIYDTNPLPNITCNICDHQCQKHCARMDYEGPVQIRAMKKIAVENGMEEFLGTYRKPEAPAQVKAAVVGAGPAGLSAAYYLCVAGFDTTVFEKEKTPGGVVANIIPDFRISPDAVKADMDFIQSCGAGFRYGVSIDQVTVQSLRDQGFDFIFYAIGSGKDNVLSLEGSGNIVGALDFLRAFKTRPMALGRHVVVTGGGNTAMDSARAAIRTEGVQDVTVVYRRSAKEMPADREEYEMALSEGVKFIFLSNPVSIDGNILTCAEMELGEPDASGRRRPVESSRRFCLDCDTLITAIGEHADRSALEKLGIPCTEKGWPEIDKTTLETAVEDVFAIGDMSTGPSTVARCMASARAAVDCATRKVLSDEQESELGSCSGSCETCTSCSSCENFEKTIEQMTRQSGQLDCEEDCIEDMDDYDYDSMELEDDFLKAIEFKKTHMDRSEMPQDLARLAKREARRCMDCTYLCTRCVDVCPNRANAAIDMGFSENSADRYQVVHLDAYCNECGNCATFCLHQGKPYKDKFTLFSRREDFDDSTNSGFLVEGDRVLVRLDGRNTECRIDRDGNLVGDVPAIVKDLIEQIFICYDYLLGRVDE